MVAIDFSSDDDDDLCPLCIEEMDLSDRNFKPCPCGYQICQFCYNNIRQNPELNGRCPACRRLYDDDSVEYKEISPEEIKRDQARQQRKEKERKQRERERKMETQEQQQKKHLVGTRVVQKNLVYVIGLNPAIPTEELQQTLKGDQFFGQYGKIKKIVVNKRTNVHGQPGTGVYVTFERKEDAARCIAAVDGSVNDGRHLRAAYGTTKYCSAYLRGHSCPNPNCMFLHEEGEEADSFGRREPIRDRSVTPHFQNQGQAVKQVQHQPPSQLQTQSQPHLPLQSASQHVQQNRPQSPAWGKSAADFVPTTRKAVEVDDCAGALSAWSRGVSALSALASMSRLTPVSGDDGDLPPLFGIAATDEGRIQVWQSALAELDKLVPRPEMDKASKSQELLAHLMKGATPPAIADSRKSDSSLEPTHIAESEHSQTPTQTQTPTPDTASSSASTPVCRLETGPDSRRIPESVIYKLCKQLDRHECDLDPVSTLRQVLKPALRRADVTRNVGATLPKSHEQFHGQSSGCVYDSTIDIDLAALPQPLVVADDPPSVWARLSERAEALAKAEEYAQNIASAAHQSRKLMA